MLRGGSWNNNQENVRASFRNRNEAGARNNNIGFRCVRDVGRRRRSPSERFACGERVLSPHPGREPDVGSVPTSNINWVLALW